MIELAIPEPFESDLRARILVDPRETCAVLFTKPSRDGRLLVFGGDLVPESAYRRRTAIAAELTPDYLVAVSNEARRLKGGVVMVHTHPGMPGLPEFSMVDDDGERPLAYFFGALFPDRTHLALVIGPDGMRARSLGSATPVKIAIVGRQIVTTGDAPGATRTAEIYDRQVRAFGAAGQHILQDLRVVVVGVGGTGSVVAQELAHLGVGSLLVIDPDQIEATNLNRVVGATPVAVGKAKVQVTDQMIAAINPGIKVEALVGDVVDAEVANRLVDADFIFSCTDSHASRAVIGQIAYQHLIPAIDIGVGIAVRDGAVSSITGRVQMLAPGLPCLLCTAALDSNAIRRELMNESQRAADPYFDGDGEPQPSVISLNATMSSLAITMFLAAMAGVPSRARHLWYDGIAGSVRPVAAKAAAGCLVCSSSGALARGVDGHLPIRRTP